MTATASIAPLESTAFNTRGGRSRSAGSETARRIANGIPRSQRITAGDQAFHVDSGRASGEAQVRLGGGGQDGSVGGGQTFDNDARAGASEALSQRRRHRLVGSDGALTRDDFRAENEVAGTKPRIEAAAQIPN